MEKKTVTRTRPRQVIVRMTNEEYLLYQQRLAKANMSGNSYGLHCLLGQPINVVENMAELIKQLKAAGNNLNQIARAANSGQTIPWEAVDQMKEGVQAVWQWLKSARVAKLAARRLTTQPKTSTVEDLPAE